LLSCILVFTNSRGCSSKVVQAAEMEPDMKEVIKEEIFLSSFSIEVIIFSSQDHWLL